MVKTVARAGADSTGNISNGGQALFTITGSVRNASTGYAIAGAHIEALYEVPSEKGGASHESLILGDSTTQPDGSFTIAWLNNERVSQTLYLIANCADANTIMRVRAGHDVIATVPAGPVTGSTKTVEIQATIPAEAVDDTIWKTLANRAGAAHINTIGGIAQQLIAPALHSPASHLSLTDRQNATVALEQAFLDPQNQLSRVAPLPPWQQLATTDGLGSYAKTLGQALSKPEIKTAFQNLTQKVEAFTDISSVDWNINPTDLKTGPTKAIVAADSQYVGQMPNNRPIYFDLDPELGYRDYLIHQWTAMITLAEYVQPHELTVDQAMTQLRNRFHQDFTTTNTGSAPANETLIPILTEILTSASGGTFGFGLPATSIPARGPASAHDYLDTLIGLTGASASELSLRYRTDFTRPDTTTSNAVWENIYTLWGFFRDSFQSVADPQATDPDILGQPIVPSKMQGRAPYFLEYDEWLLQRQPIPFENYFQIRPVFAMDISAGTRTLLQSFASSSDADKGIASYILRAAQATDLLQQALQYIDTNEFQLALNTLQQVSFLAGGLAVDTIATGVDIAGEFAARRAMKVSSLETLAEMQNRWQVTDWSSDSGATFDQWLEFNQSRAVCGMVYLAIFGAPALISQCALELGDYSTATREMGHNAYLVVGKAAFSDSDAWRDYYTNEWEGSWLNFWLYSAGDLPYTVDTEPQLQSYPSLDDDDSLYWGAGNTVQPLDTADGPLVPGGLHAVERAFYKLQMGACMLEWADTLYRADDQSDIARARELYKGVYFLHGAIPPINPTWNGMGPTNYFPNTTNPAKAAQLARAELAFTQIEAGLNYFGYSDDMVPMLRYSVLKQAADSFASEAKAAESDFIAAINQIETATVDNMKNAAMLKRSQLQAQIAQQQAGIAQDQVNQAQIVITQVNAQITAAQAAVADHDSFFGQLGDFIGGLVNIGKSIPSSMLSGVGTSVEAEAGLTSEETTGLLGLGAGASVMAGFGAFAVAGYMTMSSMATAENQRDAQVKTLQTQNLPNAQAQLDISQRSATIANLNQQVAQSDSDLATQLLTFAQDKFLNIEFWTHMANLFETVLRRYLDLATQTAWLAERALSYEQDSSLSIIGMNYFPANTEGIGGADQLQLALANLDGQYLSGLQEMVPVKQTVSLARDFPLQFAQLRKTGTCMINTTEDMVQWAYPGTYGYRVIAVEPSLARVTGKSQVRGLLTNTGVSQLSDEDGALRPSIRPADALPISEFNLSTPDMNIYGLPGATLMQFEGSGIETLWQLQFPAAANPAGLADVADILLTFNLRAQFGPTLQVSRMLAMPTSTDKMMLISARRQGIDGFTDLTGTATSAQLDFDLTALDLPQFESPRTINNVALMVIGAKNAASIAATVTGTGPPIAVTMIDGAAFSNAAPITDSLSTATPSPLNALGGSTADSTISLEIDKSNNAGVDFSGVQDVYLAVDYKATLA